MVKAQAKPIFRFLLTLCLIFSCFCFAGEQEPQYDNLSFGVPGKADLNGDNVPDYIFVSIKVWNGRFTGQADVGVFVSNPQKKYTFSAFETRHLEAEVINGKVMLVKYAYSDDDENLIRQVYTFNKDGRIQLYQADALLVSNRKSLASSLRRDFCKHVIQKVISRF